MSLNSVLVLGAGELGMAMLHALAEHPSSSQLSLAVLLRPSTASSTSDPRLSSIRDLGIHIVAGDLVEASEDALAELFKAYDTIISCTGYVAGRSIQLKLARAVIAARVPLYFPWQFGVDYELIGRGSAQDLFDEQLDVRDLLRANESATQWVVVSTGMFMSYLFEPWLGVVDVKDRARPVVRALGGWSTEVTVTTPEDIGRLTAAIFFAAIGGKEQSLVNSVVHIGGDTISYGRLAEIVGEVVGSEVTKEEWGMEKLRREFKEDPTNVLNKYRVVFGEGRGVAWDMAKTFNVQRGIPVTDALSWAKQNL